MPETTHSKQGIQNQMRQTAVSWAIYYGTAARVTLWVVWMVSIGMKVLILIFAPLIAHYGIEFAAEEDGESWSLPCKDLTVRQPLAVLGLQQAGV